MLRCCTCSLCTLCAYDLLLQQSWDAVISSLTTFKELIPEFFYLPDVLKNVNSYDLGRRQCGELVDDVKLPPFSYSSPTLTVFVDAVYALSFVHLSYLVGHPLQTTLSGNIARLWSPPMFPPTSTIGLT